MNQILSLLFLFAFSLTANAKVFYETVESTVGVNTVLLNVDNIRIDGNTVSSTNSNGNIIADPNGTGKFVLTDETASRVLVLDSNKGITSDTTTTTVLHYLDVSSSLTTLLAGKISTTLVSANIIVGNGSNVATAVDPSGDVDINNSGVFAIGSGVIVDADINASAAITATKIADGSVTSAEFQYIGTLSSDAQTQITARIPKADFTAKGQLLCATGSGTYAALTVGSNGTSPIADSAETCGVKWGAVTATPAISHYFIVEKTSGTLFFNTAITSPTTIVWNSEIADPDNGHNTSTGQFTVPTGLTGKWVFGLSVRSTAQDLESAGDGYSCFLYVSTTKTRTLSYEDVDDPNGGKVMQCVSTTDPISLTQGDVVTVRTSVDDADTTVNTVGNLPKSVWWGVYQGP